MVTINSEQSHDNSNGVETGEEEISQIERDNWIKMIMEISKIGMNGSIETAKSLNKTTYILGLAIIIILLNFFDIYIVAILGLLFLVPTIMYQYWMFSNAVGKSGLYLNLALKIVANEYNSRNQIISLLNEIEARKIQSGAVALSDFKDIKWIKNRPDLYNFKSLELDEEKEEK